MILGLNSGSVLPMEWRCLERFPTKWNHFDASLRSIRQGTLRSAMPPPNLEVVGASSVTLSRVFK